jgi:chemotaxis protein methyltransferase CheR
VEDDIVQVVPEIRNEVIFRRFNLMDRIVAKKPYHVIFCRNVMIYFDTPTKSDLIDRFYDVMAPGGYFFVGYTETIPKPSRFKYVMPSVYQKA